MATPKEYRQLADICSKLAREASELYVTAALTELANEFQAKAHKSDHERRQKSYRYARRAQLG
jgi:hypothetical protein